MQKPVCNFLPFSRTSKYACCSEKPKTWVLCCPVKLKSWPLSAQRGLKSWFRYPSLGISLSRLGLWKISESGLMGSGDSLRATSCCVYNCTSLLSGRTDFMCDSTFCWLQNAPYFCLLSSINRFESFPEKKKIKILIFFHQPLRNQTERTKNY